MKKVFAILLLLPAMAYVGLGLAMPEKVAEWGIQAERARSGLVHKTIEIDGEIWHYLEGGKPTQETVLMLHGFGADKENWTRFSRSITPDYHVIAPDLPGFGESARHPNWRYDLPSQSRRVAGFTRALGLERLHVVGNSMGGYLAALYAAENPAQIISVGLFNNGGITSPTPSDRDTAMANGRNPLVVKTAEDFHTRMQWVAHKQPFLPWPVRGVLARRAAANGAFDERIFSAIRTDRTAGLEAVLPRIKQPTLILWGRQDRILHVSSVDVMRPLMPHAEVIIMEETGHLPMIERPGRTANHYLRFINQHD